ncbi:GAF domain-containing protein [Rhodobacteraceae bacterium CCMM004]|nr:GAF domain-containing protein [Rhodobacteraceae bacterium CCMM004]
MNSEPESQAADLTNCDREPIHILGRIQSFGCLLAISPDWIVNRASSNTAAHLGIAAEDLIGVPLAEVLPPETLHRLRSQMQTLSQGDGIARIFGFPAVGDGRPFDIALHRSGRTIVLELEPVSPDRADQAERTLAVQALIGRVMRQDTVDAMAREAARALQTLTGFDRVMVYRFGEDESGHVIAEVAPPGAEPYLGLRYPASDIPKQARALYTKNLLRLIADVNDPCADIVPERGADGAPLDLSLAVTRAVSPIHLEYLRNMGVAASMSVSILRKGRLWGLFACHHDAPHLLDYQTRSAVELFAQLFAYELARVETDAELRNIEMARSLHDRMMARLSSGVDLVAAFETVAEELEDVIAFDGIAIYSGGEYRVLGAAPTREEFLGFARFLNTAETGQVFATDHIAAVYPAGEGFADRAAGALAIPVSRTPRDYLVMFRREIIRTVNWAGDPSKPVTVGPHGARLTPRKSFAAWQEVVRQHSAPWRTTERRAAEALRVTLLEVVLKLADENNATSQRAQEQQELLIAELNHRVRNILNLIRGLVGQSQENLTEVRAFAAILDARIHALARAHDQLTDRKWGWMPLKGLIETEVTAFHGEGAERVAISGDDVELSTTAFTTMALVVHELTTNSAKYGALGGRSGRVEINITLRDDGSVSIAWRERDGPPVQAPQRRGFGTTIIERSVPYELRGVARTSYNVGGFEAEFELPAPHVRLARPAPAPVAAAPKPAAPAVRLDGPVMVVEDNMIIAIDATDMLTQLGAAHVFSVSNLDGAMRTIAQHEIVFALVDVNLGTETSLPAVEALVAKGVPVVIATGYGADGGAIQGFPPVPVLRKPYTVEDVRGALDKAVEAVQNLR